MTADVKSGGTNGQTGNKDNLPSRVGDRSSRPKDQDPHAEAKAAKTQANTLGDISEKKGSTSRHQASHTCSDNIGALGSVRDRSMHHKFDQYHDC